MWRDITTSEWHAITAQSRTTFQGEKGQRDEREKKKRGKKACYHQIKKIDTNRLNLLSQKQEFYIVFIDIQNLSQYTGIYFIYTVICLNESNFSYLLLEKYAIYYFYG